MIYIQVKRETVNNLKVKPLPNTEAVIWMLENCDWNQNQLLVTPFASTLT